MPAPLFTIEGIIDLLTAWEGGSGVAGLRLDLFVNNLNPTAENVLGDFTIASFGGYAQATPSFATPVASGSFVQVADSSAQTFNPTATSQTVYGWVVSNTSTGKSVFCQRFDTPIVVTNGVPITVTAWFDAGALAA